MSASKFRDNLRARIDAHRQRTGEKLSRFSERVLGPGEARYKWLRKIYSEGSPYKREGTKNHEDLKKLHVEFGIAWPGLWEEPQPVEDEVISRLKKLLSTKLGPKIRERLVQMLDEVDSLLNTAQPVVDTQSGNQAEQKGDPSSELKLLTAIQSHPDWSRLVERIGNETDAIEHCKKAIGFTDAFLAKVSPPFPASWAEKVIRKQLG